MILETKDQIKTDFFTFYRFKPTGNIHFFTKGDDSYNSQLLFLTDLQYRMIEANQGIDFLLDAFLILNDKEENVLELVFRHLFPELFLSNPYNSDSLIRFSTEFYSVYDYKNKDNIKKMHKIFLNHFPSETLHASEMINHIFDNFFDLNAKGYEDVEGLSKTITEPLETNHFRYRGGNLIDNLKEVYNKPEDVRYLFYLRNKYLFNLLSDLSTFKGLSFYFSKVSISKFILDEDLDPKFDWAGYCDKNDENYNNLQYNFIDLEDEELFEKVEDEKELEKWIKNKTIKENFE